MLIRINIQKTRFFSLFTSPTQSQVSNLLLNSVECLPLSSQMGATKIEEVSIGMLKTDLTTPHSLQEIETGMYFNAT